MSDIKQVGKYEITVYKSGFSFKENSKIIAGIPRYWTPDGSIHKKTMEELSVYLTLEEINYLTK